MRLGLAVISFLSVVTAFGAEPKSVVIESSKTSIYIGSVTLSPAPMSRTSSGFAGRYAARVFPFFFQSEKGEVTIDATPADLAKLAAGEPVDFKGSAKSEDGDVRRIEGRATPSGPDAGKIKIRIFVSKRIELIFNTTYRFE